MRAKFSDTQFRNRLIIKNHLWAGSVKPTATAPVSWFHHKGIAQPRALTGAKLVSIERAQLSDREG